MVPNCATAEDLLKAIKDEKVQMIDLRFTDLPGVWQHFSVPPSAVNANTLDEGIGFDGSSIRGFQEIQESDMLVVPDPTTAFLDPFAPATTLVLTCNIRDPMTGQSYSRDPRYIAQKAETSLNGPGPAGQRHCARARGPKPPGGAPPLPIRAISARRRSSSYSTTCATDRASITPSTKSIPARAAGTPARRKHRIWATSRARKRDTFRFPRLTACGISAPKWC